MGKLFAMLAVSLTGIGLHSGADVTLTLHPAPADYGIHFNRTDVADDGAEKGAVAARWDRVADTRLCSALANDHGVSVGTVEHLMAALAGCGIDNVHIDLLDNFSRAVHDPFLDSLKANPNVGLVEKGREAAQ